MRRLRSIPPADFILAGALLVFGQIEVPAFGVPGDPLAAHVLWAVAAIATLFRRDHPLAFAVLGAVVVGLRYRYGLTPEGGAVFAIFGLLGIYGAGAYAHGPLRSLANATIAVLLYVLVSAWVVAAGHGPLVGLPAVEWLGQISIYIAAALGGVVLRDRSGALAAARQRAAAVPTEREAVAAALADERATVARELQALVSAAVRRVLDEAERAAALLRGSAEEAGGALGRAQAASRSALSDMRRMLTVLRSAGDERAERSPAGDPGVEGLLGRVPPLLRDQGMPLLILAIGIPEAFLSAGQPDAIYGAADVPARLLGTLALAAALVPRKRVPLVSSILVAAVLAIRIVAIDDLFALNMPLYVAAFAAGAYGRTLLSAALGGLTLLATALIVPTVVGVEFPLGAYVYVVATVAAAWATGLGGRRRLAEAEELHELAAAEEQLRVLAVHRALTEERLRVARDLHDLVGHGLTSITLQCSAGERLAGRDEPRARAAIENVESAARSTLDELAQLLAALGGLAEARLPSLEDVEELVSRARANGMEVELVGAESGESLPAGQSSAAYRIVQEALTNARKHGATAPVRIEIERDEDELRTVVTSAVGPGRGGESGGHGLIGMAERVRVYGGELEAGPAEPGTWAVRASIPLGEPEPVADPRGALA
jgi:signal transduction histidine kinase